MLTSHLSATQSCEDRDFVEWHGGCPWCAVWVLPIKEASVARRVAQARQALQPWVLPRYERQPHVTVAYRGLMAGQEAHSKAEFGLLQLQRDVRMLQAAQLAPFALTLGGVDSFSTVPYVKAALPQTLAQAHDALAMVAPYPDWHYVPHLTLGHYAVEQPMAAVMAALQASGAGASPWEETVDAIWLARYRSSDIAGPLTWEGCFDLRQQNYVPQPGALLPL
jgi:2'-5' RNA ligase